MALVLLMMIIAYVAGSVNFAILLFRLIKKGDPRDLHSGNAGTTNVYRQAGKFWAAVVLLLDVGRAGGVAVLSSLLLPPEFAAWAALALVLGNRFPCFHGFRGGKGVANFLGFSAFIAPLSAAITCGAWVLVYVIVRRPFIASFFMIASCAVGLMAAAGYHPLAIAGAAACFLFIVYNHKKNIIEMRGTKEERAG